MLSGRTHATTYRMSLSAALALAATNLPAHPAAAAEESTANCRWTGTVNLQPGLSLSSSVRGTFGSTTDSFACTGEVDGATITGPGSYTDSKPVIEGTCGEGRGSAVMNLVFATSAGEKKLSVPYQFSYGPIPLTGFKSSKPYSGPVPDEYGKTPLSWSFLVYPTRGDCVTSPVTQIGVVMEGIVHS